MRHIYWRQDKDTYCLNTVNLYRDAWIRTVPLKVS